MNIKVQRLPHATDLPLPAYATEGAAGMDLRAALDALVVHGSVTRVALGVAVEIPPGHVGWLIGRSGLASRGIVMANGVGVIDEDYRGEVVVLLVNLGSEPATVRRGDRIAQLVVVPCVRVEVVEVDALGVTGRGEGGFGSSGR